MIDLIKMLVQTLTQIIPQIGGMRADKRRRELGAELFILYVRLNEAMLAGQDIISSLETYVSRMERHLSYGDDPHALTAGSWVRGKVQHQITNFERIHRLLEGRGAVLQIIDSDSYNRLYPLLDRKFGALTILERIMRSGSLPLLPTADDLGRLMEIGHDQHAIHAAMRDMQPRNNALSTEVEWGADMYERVVSYLQERRPNEQLEEIRASLSELRKALESNFSMAEILLEVGDRRIESSWY